MAKRVFDLDGTVYTQDEDRQGWTGTCNQTCNQTCNELATDCISRQAVLDDIKSVYEWHDVVTEDRLIGCLRK